MPRGQAAYTRDDAKSIAGRIRDLRLARGWSQRELAQPRYTPAYISALEGGKTRASIEALTHIAERLGTSPAELLGGPPASDRFRLSPAAVARLAVAEEALLSAAAALRDVREAFLSPPGGQQQSARSPTRRRPRGQRRTARATPSRASRRRSRRQPALHEVIEDVIREAGHPLPAADVAARVTARGWRPPRSGHELTANQVNARTTHRAYRDRFTRTDGRIGLAKS